MPALSPCRLDIARFFQTCQCCLSSAYQRSEGTITHRTLPHHTTDIQDANEGTAIVVLAKFDPTTTVNLVSNMRIGLFKHQVIGPSIV